MKIFMDWEFLEDGHTIDPISVALVREDGREYYAVFADMPLKRIMAHDWLRANVVPSLPIVRHDGIRPLRQEDARLGFPELPEQASGVHNALADARHIKVMADYLAALEDTR